MVKSVVPANSEANVDAGRMDVITFEVELKIQKQIITSYNTQNGKQL